MVKITEYIYICESVNYLIIVTCLWGSISGEERSRREGSAKDG